jgi:hypothetical protein
MLRKEKSVEAQEVMKGEELEILLLVPLSQTKYKNY